MKTRPVVRRLTALLVALVMAFAMAMVASPAHADDFEFSIDVSLGQPYSSPGSSPRTFSVHDAPEVAGPELTPSDQDANPDGFVGDLQVDIDTAAGTITIAADDVTGFFDVVEIEIDAQDIYFRNLQVVSDDLMQVQGANGAAAVRTLETEWPSNIVLRWDTNGAGGDSPARAGTVVLSFDYETWDDRIKAPLLITVTLPCDEPGATVNGGGSLLNLPFSYGWGGGVTFPFTYVDQVDTIGAWEVIASAPGYQSINEIVVATEAGPNEFEFALIPDGMTLADCMDDDVVPGADDDDDAIPGGGSGDTGSHGNTAGTASAADGALMNGATTAALPRVGAGQTALSLLGGLLALGTGAALLLVGRQRVSNG